ncbi:murein hydrolase activator EnvC family protein [Rhodocyclaceae bacterium SMB388]
MRVTLVALLCLGGLQSASADPDVVTGRADLEAMQRRIAELEKAIGETESSRSAAAERLARAERAVSAANRRLRELTDELAAAERNLIDREAEKVAVEARIAERQAELAGWLRRHYIHGGRDMAPLLAGGDPNQLARNARYLEHLGRARLELIEGLRTDLAAQRALAASIAQRRDELVKLKAEQLARQGALDRTRAARAVAVEQLAAQLAGQREEVRGLRENEQRLASLVEVLARQASERAARARAAAGDRPDASAMSAPRSRPEASRPAAAVREARQLAGPTPTGVRFSQLRGTMGFPVRGELIGRFGAPRAEGGTRWRGIFIRAGGGEDVVAVAAGEIVFSDWMRGYGNLIIVDHGDDYLTIYGNNDALLKVVGDRISGGTPIASVGASGGGQESGLYFEVRHKGEPMDPMKWIGAR